MIIKTTILPLGSSAFTAYPFIFAHPYLANERTIKHEKIHLQQQKKWFIYGLGIGLLAWYFLYLFCLPIWWNPLRRKVETEAYFKGEGYSLAEIKEILKQAPYYLT